MEILEKFFLQLGVNSIQPVTIVGKKTSETRPIWEQTLQLIPETAIVPAPETEISPVSEPEKRFGWGSLFGKVADAATGATEAMGKATQAVSTLAGNAGNTVTGAMGKAGESAGSAIIQATGAIANKAMATGNSVTQAVGEVTGKVSHAAGETGGAIAKTSLEMAENVGNSVLQTPDRLNNLLKCMEENPWIEPLTQALKTDWMLEAIDTVDVVKTKESILQLQQQLPDYTPDQISHKVMIDKALLVGATGVATSIPGLSLALLAVDLAATTALQAEMVYQIAYAYGFEPEAPERKGEVLAVFGLALGGAQAIKFGGQYAVKAGLGVFKSVPLAGAVISASANAALLYALGYAACRFYEAKSSPIVMEATLETLQEESQHYLEAAITQETIMDQILVHMILAGNPDKTWEALLPELEPMYLAPTSLEAIRQNIHNPPPLEELLPQITPDFALSLMMQCQKMAKLDGVVTPEEAQVLNLLSQHFSVEGEAQQGLLEDLEDVIAH
ncbi:EcsC family protein [Roseofilum sp. Guam]|uniref:EcsC family protein n=1 Tax=Roseofilum sp. Guam TaxID=2821502 RepID=UPI001AFEFDA9|nr:EcsC family protein [Roseofilum sp. Guam]MBP0030390.1 EcsC family protein [Roseofilum sp. Guam]